MSPLTKLETGLKVWIQKSGKPVAGWGRIKLLLELEREGSLTRAARKLGMSYRHAWGALRELESKLGFKLVRSRRGGKGGGGVKLTPKAKELVQEYQLMAEALERISKERTFWEDLSTKFSARNRLRGRVEEVRIGEVGAVVKISVGPGKLTALITREAAEALKLKRGDEVEAVIKATEVLVAKD